MKKPNLEDYRNLFRWIAGRCRTIGGCIFWCLYGICPGFAARG